MMAASIPFRNLPYYRHGSILPDYAEQRPEALSFFSRSPREIKPIPDSGNSSYFDRDKVVTSLFEFNRELGAGEAALDNTKALSESGTCCVITGQQAGFLGGPVYTTYKIVTAIRLTEYISRTLGVNAVPVFWIASEDHDFHEINRAYFQKEDGEIGKLAFSWSQRGNSVYDLTVDDHIRGVYEQYFRECCSSGIDGEVRKIFDPGNEQNYCRWHSRLWSLLFSRHGLVIADPRCFRPFSGQFYQAVIHHGTSIRKELQESSLSLQEAGYNPTLTGDQVGTLYSYDSKGRRLRFSGGEEGEDQVVRDPSLFSADAAIRPVLADAALPVAASVLGPGELQYTAQLKGIYRLLQVEQPVVFPRLSFTFFSAEDSELCRTFGVDKEQMVTHPPGLTGFPDELAGDPLFPMFQQAEKDLREALSSLREPLQSLDPGLGKTHSRTLDAILYRLNMLKNRSMNALLSRKGYSRKEFRMMEHRILPLHRLQERIYPLPWFLHRYGIGFLDTVMEAGDLFGFQHSIVEM